jgi:CBS domain containing-hemolysin-like protein
MTLTLTIWLLVCLVGLTLSALFSGLETGAYSVNRVRLHVRSHHGDRAARQLSALLHRPTTLLATLLIGNNIANYMGTAGVTVLLESGDMTQWQVVLANVLIVTPVLFVFGETLPKDLFGAYADRLMYRFAPMLRFCRVLFTWTGLLPLIELFGAAVGAVLRMPRAGMAFHPRRYMTMLVREGVGEGLLSDEQSVIVERVLQLSSRRVRDVMVRWANVKTVRVSDPPSVLWDLAHQTRYSRFPVIDAAGKIVGVVHLYDALLHERTSCPPIKELMQPPTTLDANLPLRDCLTRLQQSHLPLAVVVQNGQPVGAVTVKDLIEPITGELARW